MTTLLAQEPGLKPKLVSLIPRPTLDAAVEAVALASKKLRDAYPYSMTSPFSNQATASTSFGSFGSYGAAPSAFGAGTFGSFGAAVARPASSVSFGFGMSSSSTTAASAFGAARPAPSSSQADGLRDEYVLSRLRPHIQEFCNIVFSYLPYFSCLTADGGADGGNNNNNKAVASDGREQVTPMETFDYLSAITRHLIEQPALAQSSLATALLPRLIQEWSGWVDRVDAHLNKNGGMFRQDVVRQWERDLNAFSDVVFHGVDNVSLKSGLKGVRDKWVSRVGWVVGRRVMYTMDA